MKNKTVSQSLARVDLCLGGNVVSNLRELCMNAFICDPLYDSVPHVGAALVACQGIVSLLTTSFLQMPSEFTFKIDLIKATESIVALLDHVAHLHTRVCVQG